MKKPVPKKKKGRKEGAWKKGKPTKEKMGIQSDLGRKVLKKEVTDAVPREKTIHQTIDE